MYSKLQNAILNSLFFPTCENNLENDKNNEEGNTNKFCSMISNNQSKIDHSIHTQKKRKFVTKRTL